MQRALILSFLALALALAPACGDDGGSSDAGADGSLPPLPDADGDGISDTDEARATNRDTDADGTPDYLDTDSDNDSIPDAQEAGDADTNTAPEDADDDGIPNFVDTDSDGNGILDLVEGVLDADGDGIENYRDTDDDNDRVPDSVELVDPSIPVDSDRDGAADFRDPDSDNDAILDGDERRATDTEATDTDGDGTPDWQDDDSDGDGFSDLIEAGDADIRTPPVDTDGDMIPDFRDADSDADGVSDADEFIGGSDPTIGDTDGDGVSDLIEIGAGTDPTDRFDNPRERGDFVFVVPYEEDPMPASDTLEFRTSIQFVDVYFLFDESGSMSSESAALVSAVSMIIDNLTCMDSGVPCSRDSMCTEDQICSLSGTCIEDPGISSCVASPWSGAGQYENRLWHDLDPQPVPATTAAAMSAWRFTGGTEHLWEAALCTADPSSPGCATYIDGTRACSAAGAGRVACPGYREEALKLLVMFTDEGDHGDGVTSAQAGAALQAAGITMIGIWSGTPTGTERPDLVQLAVDSDSVDRDGNPLVFDGDGAGVVPRVTDAINEIVENVPLRVTVVPSDVPGDAGDALQFIDYLKTNTSGGACSAIPDEDTNGDTHPDTFPAVRPGTPVCFDVFAARNTTVMPEGSPLVFEATLTVTGDGSPLDARRVFFLVPPVIVDPGGPD